MFRRTPTSPVFRDGYLFVACGHFTGGSLLKINDDLRGVTEVWHMRDFDNCHGGLILLGERLYGCGCRLGGKGFYCVDFLSGKTLATDRTLGKVALSYADGMLYALNHERPFYLLEVKPDGFEIVSQFTLPKKGRGPAISHPGHLRRPAVRPVRRVFVLLGYSRAAERIASLECGDLSPLSLPFRLFCRDDGEGEGKERRKEEGRRKKAATSRRTPKRTKTQTLPPEQTS